MAVALTICQKKMLKIKTKCGKDKYKVLRKGSGPYSKLRLYSFLILGGLRDFFKKEE